MNYRHAFHAGNHADVLKHAVFARVLHRLARKPKPMTVIDAFAGPGAFDLALDERALRTGEWASGVGALLSGGPLDGAAADPEALTLAAPDAPDAAAPYLAALAALNSQGRLRHYPGSPLIAAAALRDGDKLLAVERHDEEAETLRRALEVGASNAEAARVYAADGWAQLRSFLPPSPRRGAVLIDPPFEAPDEAERLVAAATDGLRRWATGVFLLWSPIKDYAAADALDAALAAAGGETPFLRLRLTTGASQGLLGSSLAVFNPPYGLDEDADALGAWIAPRLARGDGGWSAAWITPAA